MYVYNTSPDSTNLPSCFQPSLGTVLQATAIYFYNRLLTRRRYFLHIYLHNNINTLYSLTQLREKNGGWCQTVTSCSINTNLQQLDLSSITQQFTVIAQSRLQVLTPGLE
jgi:hypothetical protein